MGQGAWLKTSAGSTRKPLLAEFSKRLLDVVLWGKDICGKVTYSEVGPQRASHTLPISQPRTRPVLPRTSANAGKDGSQFSNRIHHNVCFLSNKVDYAHDLELQWQFQRFLFSRFQIIRKPLPHPLLLGGSYCTLD